MKRPTIKHWIRDHWERHGREWVVSNYPKACEDIGREINYETWSRMLRLEREDRELAGKTTEIGRELESHQVDTEGKSELYHDVDPSEWKARKLRVNTWGSDSNANKQVRIEYDRRAELDPKLFADRVMEILGKIAPEYPAIKRPKTISDRVAEVVITDHHFGSREWRTPDEARRVFLDAIHGLMAPYEEHSFNRILFPIGNDYLNYDNWNQTTTHGTDLPDSQAEVDDVIDAGQRALIEGIDYLTNFGNVEVIVIPGNHDWLLAHMLGRVLEAWYANSLHVIVDRELNGWKFRNAGNWLLALTHGKHPDSKKSMSVTELAAAIPVMQPLLWAGSTYREVHTGHFHTKAGGEVPWYKDHQGVIVRRIASLKPKGAWEDAQNYHSGREAEMFIFRKDGIDETRTYRP
jgi:hypothetical protein